MAGKRKVKKQELGLGIRALLNSTPPPRKESPKKDNTPSSEVARIQLAQISVNPDQPRKEFDLEKLEELSNSIKTYGLIQPITVRQLSNNEYQLISGERRYRASKMAGLTEVPTYIRVADDQNMLEMALVENIQRADLNPLEIAFTYSRLMKEFEITHNELSERVGKKRSTVSNYINLLNLPPSIQQALKKKEISMGHAKVLNGVKNITIQLSLLNQIRDKGLSVRATENLAKLMQGTSNEHTKTQNELPSVYIDVQKNLRKLLSARVKIKLKGKEKGQINISFNNTEELNRILDIIEGE